MENQYTYKIFSRRNGNLSQLVRFKDAITRFYVERYLEYDIDEYGENIVTGITRDWAGAILVFDATNRTVGFMNYYEVNPENRTFDVGFAFVEEDHRRKGLWTRMSEMVETEVRQMGGE